MVVASAGSVTGNALDSAASAIIDAIAGRFRRKIWNILFSPDVKAVKDRSSLVHAACYLGGVTRCNSTKILDLHWSGGASMSFLQPACRRGANTPTLSRLFH